MHCNSRISLHSIAGLIPKVSTFDDVLRLHGNSYEVERLPADQTKRRLIPPKILLRFPDSKIVAVFIDPGGELPAEALMTTVGVDEGSTLQTSDGLRVGITMVEAEAIVTSGYRVLRRSSSCVDALAADDSSENYLSLFDVDGKVAYIGLYLREACDY